jgi:phage-related protein
MKTTTLNNGLKVLDKYYINRTQAERGQHNLMRDHGTKSYIWKNPFGGRVFWVVLED